MAVVRIQGDKELIQAIRSLKSELLPDLAEVVDRANTMAGVQARAHVPRDTGALAASFTQADTTVNEQRFTAEARVGFRLERSPYVEVGARAGVRKSNSAPRFLFQAARSQRTAFRKALHAQARATIARIAKPTAK